MARKGNKATVVPEKVKETPVVAPEVISEGVVRVCAVVRPMYAPDDNVLIPEGGTGVLIKEGSWATSQLERGLLRKVG